MNRTPNSENLTFNPNQAHEQTYWESRSRIPSSNPNYPFSQPTRLSPADQDEYLGTRSHHIRKSSLKEKIDGLVKGRANLGLPMYKDKPHQPVDRGAIWRALFPRGRRKRWITPGLLVFVMLWYTGLFRIVMGPGSDATVKSRWWWPTSGRIDWNARRDLVREAFVVSWDDYAQHAWGMDVYSPISGRSSMIAKSGRGENSASGGLGWIIVDALDTAMIMNLTSKVAQAREWIESSLDFAQIDGEVSTFETTIRILGGLLSAHYLSTSFPTLAAQRDDDTGMRGEDLYIEKAVDLADRLLGAFDTPSGIPLSGINLNTSTGIPSKDPYGVSSTAEATSLQLELKYLAKITGEPLYWERAEQIMRVIDAPRHTGGLLPIFIDPFTGQFRGSNIRLGSRGDSYYEYLIKQYLQTGSRETIYQEMWEEALAGIKKYLISFSKNGNFTILGERIEGLHAPLSGKMDHLVCFMPGTIALAVTEGQTVAEAKARLGAGWGKKQEDNLLLAEELLKTCWGMYKVTPTKLAPEIAFMVLDTPHRKYPSPETDPQWVQPRSNADFDEPDREYSNTSTPDWRHDFVIQPNDVHNLQRPETVESMYYLYRITRDEKYRRWGWEMFRAFMEHTKVTDQHGRVTGYTSLESVMRDPHYDKRRQQNMEDDGVKAVMLGYRKVIPGLVIRDSMEGFWLSETLKYLYLLFTDDDQVSPTDEWFDLSKVVISTEAHFFPRFDIQGSKVWKTGWVRAERKTVVTMTEEGESSTGTVPRTGQLAAKLAAQMTEQKNKEN